MPPVWIEIYLPGVFKTCKDLSLCKPNFWAKLSNEPSKENLESVAIESVMEVSWTAKCSLDLDFNKP